MSVLKCAIPAVRYGEIQGFLSRKIQEVVHNFLI